jgi:quercetin dioxygenase-like cupin family protein
MTTKPKMQIFRATEGEVSSPQADDPDILPMSEATQEGFVRLVEAGIADGALVKTLFDIPGFALTYVWFKPHYPLPRHSHKRDCLYYIVSGSIKYGTEWLGAGDGFFLPDATPYTYAVGDEGVELLEFRHSNDINFKAYGGTQAWWDAAAKSIGKNRAAWQAMVPPRAALSE